MWLIMVMFVIFTTAFTNLLAYEDMGRFILITTLYNETNKERCQEYITCLEKNLSHPLIESVHVLYDNAKDTEDNQLLAHMKNMRGMPITISYIVGRPSYGDCFALANRLYPDRSIILCNGDIYFNETLHKLKHYNLAGKFLALTRWDVGRDGSLEIFRQYNNGVFCPIWSETSQDAWIFQTPIRKFEMDTIKLGTMTCDSLIAYQAYAAGLQVINPCWSIQACHMHLSQVRNYDSTLRGQGQWMSVPWCEL
ncbi:MAG TPA: hypothetical protein VHA52_11705 [Candidatus Babeliaceae bacterium]|nr:hypothetical protein [Candidatus Babeliaceae bacterium]